MKNPLIFNFLQDDTMAVEFLMKVGESRIISNVCTLTPDLTVCSKRWQTGAKLHMTVPTDKYWQMSSNTSIGNFSSLETVNWSFSIFDWSPDFWN
jgi:hypothetical protein